MPPDPSDVILPAKFGLIIWYAAFGFLGGAGASLSGAVPPRVRGLVYRGLIGTVAAVISGSACLAKFGTDDQAIWWGICVTTVSGFVGPAAVIQWLERRQPTKESP